MKTLNPIIISLLIATMLIGQSCSEGHQHGEKDDKTKTENSKPHDHAEKKEESHHGKAKPVKLNDGKKWEANPATTEGIKKMQKIMMDDDNSIEEKHKELIAAFNTIFEKCTMKGEAHNQLHNYLLPLKKQFEKLENCEEEQTCDKVTATIKEHLNKYSNYFK